MFRNSVLYHRLWYIKRRTSKRIHIYIRLAVIFIILSLLVSYANKKLLPSLVEISEFKARATVVMSINKIVNDTFSSGVEYEDLITLKRDNSGRITSIETNVVKLNRLSASVTSQIQTRLMERGRNTVSVPFGSLLGSPILAGAGPDLHIRVKQVGNVETDFRSEFTSAGINQTRHRIYIQVKTKIGIVCPLVTKKTQIVTNIPVAETIIVGSVPEVYLRSG